jgi:hypothetical protein
MLKRVKEDSPSIILNPIKKGSNPYILLCVNTWQAEDITADVFMTAA